MKQEKKPNTDQYESQRLTRIEEKIDSLNDAVVRFVALNETIPARVQVLEGDSRQQHTLVNIISDRLTKVEARVDVHDKDRVRLEGGWWVVLKVGGFVAVVASACAWFWTNVVAPLLQRNPL